MFSHPRSRRRLPAKQGGVIVIFTLLAVVILLIASVALVRSMDTSLTLAGNMAFKRDLVNQSERAVATAIAAVSGTGALGLEATRLTDSLANNYSAVKLPTDAHGIPVILVDDAAWATKGMTGADITDSGAAITVRYVIDRLCTTATEATLTNCAMAVAAFNAGSFNGDAREGTPLVTNSPVYRISVRVTGPRNTQSFVQSTISVKS